MAQTAEIKRAKQRECMRRWRDGNRETARARNRAHYRGNRAPYLARAVRKRAYAPEAVPTWLTKEHWREIASFYQRAEEMTMRSGVYHVVDHIDPLKGANSCGLHVPWNLQVVTHAFNVGKASKERGG